MLDQNVFKSGYGVSVNNATASRETNDCVVRAIANAFEVSYNAAQRVFKIKHVGDMPKLDGNLKNPKYKHKPVAYTVKTFMQNFKRGTYLIIVNKHALTVKNGVLIDNANYRFEGYRRPVESAFKILG